MPRGIRRSRKPGHPKMSDGIQLDAAVLACYEALLRSSSMHRLCEGLPEALSDTIGYLRSMPAEFQITWFRDPTPERIGEDPAEAMANAVNDTVEWLGFAHRSVAYRAHELATEFVRALNARSYPTVVFSARALLELAALLHLQLKSILGHAAAIGALEREDLEGFTLLPQSRKQDIAKTVFEAWKEIRMSSAKTRFNWLAAWPFGSGHLALNFSEKNLPEHLRQDHVLKAIDKLEMSGPRPQNATFRLYYEMICDFVHPNLGSIVIFIDQACPAGPNKWLYVLHRKTKSQEVTQLVLEAVSIPVREALRILQADLVELDREYERLRKTLR